MRRRRDFEQALLAARHERRLVACEHGRERLLCLPFGVLRRERLDAVEREGELVIHWLLAPQGAIVVEGGDTLGRRNEIRAALGRQAGDEIGDGCLHRVFVPRGCRYAEPSSMPPRQSTL